MLALLSAVRTGRGDYARWFGRGFTELVHASPGWLDERIADEASGGEWVIGPLVSTGVFDDLGSVVVCGRAAAPIADALVERNSALRVTVVATPAEIAAIERFHPVHERITLESGSPLHARTEQAGAALISGGLASHPDADAVHVLRQATAGVHAGGPVLLFCEVLDEALAHEHDDEHDLLDLAMHGGGARSDAEHRALFADAGLTVRARRTVGWGYTLYRLTP